MEQLELSLDENGFPSEQSVQRIQAWRGSPADLLLAVKVVWGGIAGGDWVEEEVRHEIFHDSQVRRYSLHTGGVSGKEALITALQNNAMFWLVTWARSRPNGHYIFELPIAAPVADETAERVMQSSGNLPRMVISILEYRAEALKLLRKLSPELADIFDEDPRLAVEISTMMLCPAIVAERNPTC